MLTLLITRTSPTHHRLEYKREDGTGEASEIETKSFLMHDLLHFSLESTVGIKGGFFGLLSDGLTYAELSGKMPAEFEKGEVLHVERAVGAMAGMAKGAVSAEQAVGGLKNVAEAYGEELPPWLSVHTLNQAMEKYRQLMGRWNSLKFGETLEIDFP